MKKEILRNINILINVEKSYIPKVEYVFRTFCKILGLQPQFSYFISYEDVHVYYGIQQEESYPITISYSRDAALFFENKGSYLVEKVIFYEFKNEKIPFLFSDYGNLYSYINKRKVYINKDIISSAFYFLSCWQEFSMNRPLSPGNVYDFTQSLHFYWDFKNIPIVDRYANIFQKAMEVVLPGYQKIKKWPKDKSFALSVSHHLNFDELFYKIKEEKDELSKRKKYINFKRIENAIKKTAEIVKKENKVNLSSTFFTSYNKKQETKSFQIDSLFTKIKQVIQFNETSLLGSFTSGYYEDILRNEYEELSEIILDLDGYRAETLSIHYQFCFSILEKIKLKYDSTLGFLNPGISGFRAGISYPFNPFNIKENRPFNILEIPLSLIFTKTDNMPEYNEKTTILNHKLKVLFKEAYIEKSHLSLLSDYLYFQDRKERKKWEKIYWGSIKIAEKYNCWFCSLREIYNYWSKR